MSEIEKSPQINTVCKNCLRDFTVHFRRPYNVGKATTEYSGEFGFDWMRDEYIYPILKVNGEIKEVISIYSNDTLRLLKENFYGNVNIFIDEGKYFPSWLSIFATKTGANIETEQINKDGANLNIEIHQDKNDAKEALSDDGTILIFRASNKNIKLSTFGKNQQENIVKEPLSRFIGTARENRNLGKFDRKFYNTKQAINITCSGGYFSKDEYVVVQAEKNGKIKEVGLILLARNNNTLNMNIKIVDVKVNGVVLGKPENYEYELKNKVFNQCLLGLTFFKKEIFDLDELAKTDDSVRNFIKTWWQDKQCMDDNTNYVDAMIHEPSDFQDELVELYEKTKWRLFNINSKAEKTTYVFYTPIRFRDPPTYSGSPMKIESWYQVSGSADRGLDENGFRVVKNLEVKWGNNVVVYQDGFDVLKTLGHELIHSLGLFHVFDGEQIIQYNMGYTDNIMDYSYDSNGHDSKFTDSQWFFRKDQADQLRDDRSVRVFY